MTGGECRNGAGAEGGDVDEIGILVTGVGAGSTGEQVVKALRRGRRRYRIAAGNVDPARTVVVAGVARVELPPARDPAYLDALAAAAERHGARFLVPGTDAELTRIVAGREALGRLTAAIPLVNDAAVIATCSDKARTAQAVGRSGLRAPRTAECETVAGALAAAGEGGVPYPVVLKPRHGGGSADVWVAQDAGELRFHAERALRGGGGVVLQEYAGDPDHEFTVGVLHAPDGALLGSVALRRELSSLLSVRSRAPNRTGRAELGAELVVSSGFTQGHVDDFPGVRAQAERLAASLGSRGPLNVQGRLVGEALVVFEVNPRFSGTEVMRAMAGWNAPEALVDWHLGAGNPLAGFRARPRTFIRTLAEHELERAPAPRAALPGGASVRP
jgi:carbamoyl-phosphate synthase large subunit